MGRWMTKILFGISGYMWLNEIEEEGLIKIIKI